MIKKIIKNYLDRRVKSQVDKSLRKFGYVPITETTDQDIFIVGFPKSGNTWMQFMITSLVYGIIPERLSVPLVLEFVPDVHYKKIYKRYQSQCFFKSHDLPKKEHRRVIYLVRDGRDAMVSYYYMNKNIYPNYTFEDLLVKKLGLFPSKWHEHIKAWASNPFGAEILIVRYEDLKVSTFEQMKKVCSFIGIERSEKEINDVIEGCTLDKLKKIESEKGLGDANYKFEGKGENTFFRKGIVGGYVKEFPDELKKEFEKESFEELKKFGYSTDLQ